MLGHDTSVAHDVTETTLPLRRLGRFLLRLDVAPARVSALPILGIDFHAGTVRLFQFVLAPVFFQLLAQPVLGDVEHLGRVVLRLELLVHVQVLHLTLPSAVAGVSHVEEVAGPVVEAVEDVGGVQDGGLALFGFPDEPSQQVLTHANVQTGRHLVQQQDFERPDESQQELDATALPVTQLVHAPVQVDAEHLDELIAAFGVTGLQLLHHAVNGNVGRQWHGGADERDALHAPVAIQIGTVEVELGVAEGVHAQDLDFLLGQVTAGEDAQQGGLAGSVGADEQASRSGFEREVQSLQDVLGHVDRRAGSGVREGQIVDLDGIGAVVGDFGQRLWCHGHRHCVAVAVVYCVRRRR
mmetsp:Transcript_5865/g.17515  ORF Transcript_5865/g.17515 Transcript_5865/m.17515 type:complete len:354 (+) Transcript_5865:97-1158(+)